jgi:Bifunctional PLP-dependent enzyme with beta-cystathionase and maltose regulon repressor activities
MKQYNFDEIIDRKGTNCIKVDKLDERYGRSDLTAMWVADMDFRTPDFIIDAPQALRARSVWLHFCR